MAIPGLNLNTAANFSNLNNRSDASQNAQQNNTSSSGRQITALNQSTATGGPQTVNSDGAQVSATTSLRIPPATQTDQPSRAVTSRRDPAETEAFANQFRLQRDSDQGNSQIRQFISVANFEQRDQLAQGTGIDIFV